MDESINISLQKAIEQNDIDRFLELAQKAKSELFKPNHEGKNFLHLVIENRNLQWLNNQSFLKMLNTDIVNQKDDYGNTALHSLLTDFMFSDAELKAIDTLTTLGNSVHIKNNRNRTVLSEFFYKFIHFNAKLKKSKIAKAKIIKNKNFELNTDELKQFAFSHLLYVVFGGEKIDEDIDSDNSFFSGGRSKEGVNFLKEMLSSYHQNNPAQIEGYKKILAAFDCYVPHYLIQKNIDEIIKSILSGKLFYTDPGSERHTISALFEKINDEIIVTLAEKGIWSPETNTNKVNGISHFRFKATEKNIRKILEGLVKAKSKSNEESHEDIYHRLPALVNSNIQMGNSKGETLYSTPFKIGICFYANHKLLLEYLFTKYLSNSKVEFKKFDLYLHTKILEDYLKTISQHQHNENLIRRCQEIIIQKQKNLAAYIALQNDDQQTFEKMIKQGSNINLSLIFNLIAYHPELNILDKLKKYGFNLDTRNAKGETLLLIAAAQNDLEFFLKLIELGASITATDKYQNNYLQILIDRRNYHWFNYDKFLKLIIPEDINHQDGTGNSVMHIAFEKLAFNDNPDILSVFKVLIAKEGNIHLKNKREQSPEALLFNRLATLDGSLYKERVKRIERFNQEKIYTIDLAKLNQFILMHQLYITFGGLKLSQNLGFKDGFFKLGRHTEALAFLEIVLEKFIEEKHPHCSQLKSILKIFNESLKIENIETQYEEYAEKICMGQSLMIDGGSTNTIAAVLFEKQNNEIILTLVDRAVWALHVTDQKVNGIFSIKFKADESIISNVLKLIIKCDNLNKTEAFNALLDQLPKLTNSQFKFANSNDQIILSSPSTSYLAFYTNFKLLLHEMLIRNHFNGSKMFKEFDIYIREYALKNYQRDIEPKDQDQQLIKTCQEIIENKKVKLFITQGKYPCFYLNPIKLITEKPSDQENKKSFVQEWKNN